MRKLSIIVFLMFSLLLSGMTQAVSIDITAPGDTVKGLPDVPGGWPDAEAPPYAIDNNVNTKYLYLNGGSQTTGFAVTPSGDKIVTGMSFTTANDSARRDPVTFELSGSNDSIDGPWTPIATGDIVDFSQPAEWPRLTKNATPISFANGTAYAHYQVLFTVLRGPGEHMQIAEVELLATVPSPAGWAYKDIDTSGGYAWEDAGTIIITANGADIWGGSDSFGYLYRPLIGGGSLEVNLLEAGNTNAGGWSKVGPMIRETLTGGSKHGVTAMTGTNGIQFVYRLGTGGVSAGMQRPGLSPPKRLKIERVVNKVKSWYWGKWDPLEPPTWLLVGEQTIMMDTDITIGIAVCAGNEAALNTAVLNGVVLIADPVEYPWAMSPEDGAANVSLTPTLSWMAGDSATSHDVYLSTDSADMGTPVTTTVPSYSPTLVANTTYYWKVVEQPGDYASPVISFTTIYEAPWYTGTLNWEQWTDIPWVEVQRLVDSVKYQQEPPDYVDEMPDAKSPIIGTDTPVENYGVRMSGHLIPGTSGDYTFWIAADDGCRLLLNTDNDVADLVKRAGWYRYSGNFDAHPEQMSATIPLVGGQKYAIEILLKEAGGGDWVEVAWEGPDTEYNRTRITGTFLTAAYAVNAKPGIRATVTPLDAETLSWTAGKYATSQEVLFGTDPAAMASIATLPADPTVIVERSTLPMPAVAAGNTYYWQVISTDGTETWEGDVWSFTVSDWVGRDIGVHRFDDAKPEPPVGSSTYDEDTDITVINVGGHELWGDWDQFHFRYTKMKMTHDVGTIQARMLSLVQPPPPDWVRAGVMIRETLDGSSRMALMHQTGHDNNITRAQWRTNPREGKNATSQADGLGLPIWVRLTRDGDRFDAYHSQDGENWTYRGTFNIPMEPGQPVYLGMAASHNPRLDQSLLTTATFDNFSFTTPDPLQSWNLNPPNGATAVNIHTTLTWGAGEGVTEHHVYFSSDEAAVVSRDPTVETILPAETLELYVGPLVLGTVYYWAVDEAINPVTPGEVVSFAVEDYRIIDDFEAYDVPPEALPSQVFVPGEILVEAVPPPEQVETVAGHTVTAEPPPAQVEIDPGVIVEPGYTIPGYTIPGYTIEAIEPDVGCLVAHYEFEGNANDSTANANNGTVHGDPVYAAGMVGDAIVCDATDDHNDYVIVPDSASLSFGTGPFSIGCWVNSSWSGGDKEFLVKNGSAGSEFGGKPPDGPNSGKRYVLKFDGSTFRFAIDDDTTKTVCETTTSDIATGDWLHVTAIRNRVDDKMYIYADGVMVVQKADATELSIDSPGELMSIAAAQKENGTYVEEIGHWFNGQLDDMRFYNCALSEGNARFLAGVGDKVVDPIEVPPVEVPPVIEGAVYEPMLVHYEFEGTGNDSSGNAHHGTAVQGDDNSRWPTYTSGKVGQAAKFYDDGEHFKDDDAGDYMDGLEELTISCWIKSDRTGRDEGWIIFGTQWSDRRGMRYDSKGGDSRELKNIIKYGVQTDDGREEDESSGELQTKNWQHVAMVWQRNVGIKLYVDGLLDNQGYDKDPVAGVLEDYSRMLVGKGSKDDSGGESWKGLIDELRIYNTVLSYGQIRYLADEMDDLYVPPVCSPMIAEYKFDTDASDTSGNDYHGTMSGDASIIDGVLNLDGNGDYVNIGNHARFNPVRAPFSVSAWVNLASFGNNWANVIISKRGENRRGWQLRKLGDTNRISFTTRNCNDSDGWGDGGQDISLGEWHHIAAVRDGSWKWLYIDGQREANSEICDKLEWSGHDLYIGARATGDNRNRDAFHDGMIDDVRVYDIPLTEGEVRYLADLGNIQLPDAYVPLRAHYEFEGDVLDSTANANHGTVNGDPVYVGGPLGQAIDLDGDGDYVSTGKKASELGINGNNPRTLSAWVLTRGFCNGGIYDVGNRSGGQDFSLRTLDCQDNRWRIQYWGGDYDFSHDTKDKWVHFSHVHTGAYTQIYADGELIVNWAKTINTTDNNPFQVGMYGWTGNAFDGVIDDMRVYDTVLNLGQLRTLAGYVPSPDILDTWSGRAAAAPALEWKAPAHEGSKSMRVSYTGSGAVTRLEPFGDGKHPHGWNGDFSLGQAQALSLWFRGDPQNAPGAMFAQLTTVVPSGHTQRVIYDGPPEDLQNPNWQEWTMSLKALSTGKPADPVTEMGLPITKIKDVGVGIIGAGGGTLYFDDLRLYPNRCVPKYIESAYDLTNDCAVDREDMIVIANSWLAQEGDNGLWYEYYELAAGDPTWSVIPYLPSLPMPSQGTADNFGVGPRLRGDDFALRFIGIVAAPVGGEYTFYTNSDDGSKLYIDGEQVVDNDGLHGMGAPVGGTITLDAGEHVIEVTMFERGGGEGLAVEVEGPGIPRMPIPNEVLFLAPGIPSDLNGDGIVNFLDYADLLNHFGDEVPLFPPPGEQL